MGAFGPAGAFAEGRREAAVKIRRIRPHSRASRAELLIAAIGSMLILMLSLAALIGGGIITIHSSKSNVEFGNEVTNATGHATFPLRDGKTCRDLVFNNNSGDIIKSGDHPCREEKVYAQPRRFIWGGK
jgi:hypothetical protein